MEPKQQIKFEQNNYKFVNFRPVVTARPSGRFFRWLGYLVWFVVGGIALAHCANNAGAQTVPPRSSPPPMPSSTSAEQQCGWIGQNWVCSYGWGKGEVCTKVGDRWNCRQR